MCVYGSIMGDAQHQSNTKQRQYRQMQAEENRKHKTMENTKQWQTQNNGNNKRNKQCYVQPSTVPLQVGLHTQIAARCFLHSHLTHGTHDGGRAAAVRTTAQWQAEAAGSTASVQHHEWGIHNATSGAHARPINNCMDSSESQTWRCMTHQRCQIRH